LLLVRAYAERLAHLFFTLRRAKGFSGKLYSSEYQKHFETEHSVAEIKPLISDPDRLQLTIDGVTDVGWFKQKQKEFLEKIGVNVKPKIQVNRGIK